MNHSKFMPYLYVTPALMMVCLFIYYPALENIIQSFYQFTPFSSLKTFVGLNNYTRLFQDNVFLLALKNNALHMAVSLLVQVAGGLVLAAIVEDLFFRRVSSLLRTIFFLPVLISITATGLLFSFIYNPQIGLLNQALNALGLSAWTTGWLGNSHTAFWAVMAMGQWIGIGYTMMLFIVAIQKIPEDLYDAARIDGCNALQRFWHITVPQVSPMLFVAVVFTISQSMLVFADVYVLTGGGPGYSTQVLSTYLYNKAFVQSDMGYASAVANVIFALSILLYALQTRLFRHHREA